MILFTSLLSAFTAYIIIFIALFYSFRATLNISNFPILSYFLVSVLCNNISNSLGCLLLIINILL